MNNVSRINNSIRNTIYGVVTQFIIVLLSFITRTFFIKYLSVEYLGVNGLFTNILTVLSLAELGFDGAMVFSMYQPLAIKDHEKLNKLMNFYSNIYKRIGYTVGVLGLLLIPFLNILVKDTPNIEHLIIIYVLFLFNSVSSYFFVYKKSILQADQKQFLISKNYLVFSILKSIFQILVLILFKNYLLFLAIQIMMTIFENISISKIVNKVYPYLNEGGKLELEEFERKKIWTNVRSLMIYKVGSTVLDGTDNIIISTLVGVSAIGYLSNYTLIISAVSMVLQQVTNALTGSIGNYVTMESEEKQEKLFERVVFIYFIFFGFSFVCLFMLLNPFISIWLGEEFKMSLAIVFIISLNWYITGMMNPVWTFRTTKGLFVYGRYRPIISAVLNLIVSVVLGLYWGVIGVLFGTTITRLLTNFWYDPYIVYKYGFNRSPKKYYFRQIIYTGSLVIPISIITILFKYMPDDNLIFFIYKCGLVLLVTIITLIGLFHKTKEFEYFLQIVIEIKRKVFK